MSSTAISFPNLHIDLGFVPKSFDVFGFTIALYGVIIAFGMYCGLAIAMKIAGKTGQDRETYWDFAMIAIIVSVICARIYYVVFSWDSYRGDIKAILNMRNGGLAIYGGVIGAFITVFAFSKIKKLDPRVLGDTGVMGLILGQIIGRWGNFTNREAFGEYTDGLFAMRLPIVSVRSWEISDTMWEHVGEGIDYVQVHPTFLYESLCNLIVLALMLLYYQHKRFRGEMCLFYFAGYGLVRFFVEPLRTDQLLIKGTDIPVSQLLSAILCILAILVDVAIRLYLKRKGIARDPETLWKLSKITVQPVMAETTETEETVEEKADNKAE